MLPSRALASVPSKLLYNYYVIFLKTSLDQARVGVDMWHTGVAKQYIYMYARGGEEDDDR